MSDQVLQDQLFLFGRLLAEPRLATVSILNESKGVTEADINQSLSILNERGGKIGACIVVLMPTLTPDSPNAPGPRFTIRQTAQVIEQPLFNLTDDGTNLPASSIAEVVRKLGHHFNTGFSGVYVFAGQEPAVVDEGKVSYLVRFDRVATDGNEAKVLRPVIAVSQAEAPATVTLTCGSAGASIYYTTDGSYPSSANPAATLYTAPFTQATAATICAAAELTDFQQSDITTATLT